MFSKNKIAIHVFVLTSSKINIKQNYTEKYKESFKKITPNPTT